jgi:hypothetical protein
MISGLDDPKCDKNPLLLNNDIIKPKAPKEKTKE